MSGFQIERAPIRAAWGMAAAGGQPQPAPATVHPIFVLESTCQNEVLGAFVETSFSNRRVCPPAYDPNVLVRRPVQLHNAL